jgi:hypothetical protein
VSEQRKPSPWKERLLRVYWVVVGVYGIGQPIVDRHSMFGDDPKNDPYSLDYDPSSQRRR